MATYIRGIVDWRGGRDAEGYRSYKLTTRVISDTAEDGPANVLQTPGLPLPGTIWFFRDDIDVYVWCRADTVVTPVLSGENNLHWNVEQTFSNKPSPRNQQPGRQRGQGCHETQIEDPLLEPPKMSGGCSKFQEEATTNYDGTAIINSAFEVVRGPQVEFDKNRPTVSIQQNVATFYLAAVLPNLCVDHVNDSSLWGYAARCIKLSSYSWEPQYHGSCYKYYSRTLEFEFNPETFDRDIPDEGTKALHGEWTRYGWEVTEIVDGDVGYVPNPANPADFIRFRDRSGELARVFLNGRGIPYNVENTGTHDDTQGRIAVRYYRQANLLLLGIPALLG